MLFVVEAFVDVVANVVVMVVALVVVVAKTVVGCSFIFLCLLKFNGGWYTWMEDEGVDERSGLEMITVVW